MSVAWRCQLANQVLRGVDMEQAYRHAKQKMDAEFDWECVFGDSHPDLALSAGSSAGDG